MSDDAQGGARLDPDQIRQKYLSERDKRLNPLGLEQYLSAAGGFRSFAEDPYAGEPAERAPVVDDVDVVVLGGGFSGVLAAVRLQQSGVEDILMIEKAGDFGGTWYWNRYPGIRCDIESYIYLPLLEETGYVPSEKYVRGAEIFSYFQLVGRTFGLYDRALFQTVITAISWDEEAERWIVETDRGDAVRARFVTLGGAGLHRPKLPGVPGIEDYKGKMFHTSRWDYDYTGVQLEHLADKRVAVVGTGATGIQVVPNIARQCGELVVVQRTPSTVDVRGNRPTDPDWVAGLEPGWQSRRRENFTALVSGQPRDEDLVGDAWTDVARRIGLFAGGGPVSPDAKRLADLRKMDELRGRVESVVQDPATAESLKPWYSYLCKRPTFSDEYLQAFNEPNVRLVDTDGRGLEQITETGFEAGGEHHEVDCIIFATGFDSFPPIYETGEFDLLGRGGASLAERWSEGVASLHGMYLHGFPNLFLTGSKAHAASSANVPHVIDGQAVHVAAVVSSCLEKGISVMEVTPAAEERWEAVIESKRLDMEDFYRECTPGYFNREGAKDRKSILAEAYGGGPLSYLETLASWREQGMDQDVALTYDK